MFTEGKKYKVFLEYYYMVAKIINILEDVLKKIEPEKEELNLIKNTVKEFIKDLTKRTKKSKIKAEIFVGGSLAKKTVIKKGAYDVDIFLRFDNKYKNNEISGLTKKLLKGIKNVLIVHGSRDYFRVQINKNFYIELIPVIKVSNPKEAQNITDLSYSHVKYINKRVKSKKVLNDIRIAKAFCHANKCYGAESYIKGFSGYGLELLVYHYKGFLKFVKAMSKIKEKVVIDIEKDHKNKQSILMDLNSSKLDSPIILIDPTFKQRNVLAALSDSTFKKFQTDCKKFLKNPNIKSFEIIETDLDKVQKEAKKKKQEFILLEAKTNRQEGDIAGSKLLKFYGHLDYEISKFFDIKKKGFNYGGIQSARYFFVVNKKKEILLCGPRISDNKNVKKFKKQHKKTFIKAKNICAKEKINFDIKEFMNNWRKKNKNRIKEMYILDLKII